MEVVDSKEQNDVRGENILFLLNFKRRMKNEKSNLSFSWTYCKNLLVKLTTRLAELINMNSAQKYGIIRITTTCYGIMF